MSFATSIHVKTHQVECVCSVLNELRAHRCFVGKSGVDWVGIASEECEITAGEETPKLAKRLSERVHTFVFALCVYEEAFQFWLFREGEQLDRHPLTRLGQFRVKERPIIDLCISPEAAQRLKRLLEEKPDTRQPSEILGLSEEEYYAKIYRDLDRARLMTPEQIKKLRDEYKDVLSGVFEGAKLVCECVGIRVFGLNYSDFADPTTEARQMYKFQHL